MAFARRSNRVLRLCVILLLLPLVMRFVLALFFYSHVVSNRAACHGTENGVVVHVMSGNAADHCAFQATGGFGSGDAAEREAGSNSSDNDVFHDRGSHVSKGQLGRGRTDFNRV
jgi:hypothetical protein